MDACSLLSVVKASALSGKKFTSVTPKVIANGQDSGDYANAGAGIDMTVIVYQANSGVSLQMMSEVNDGKPISGVGDKAIISDIELDAQVGDRLIAVQGAGGTMTQDQDHAVAKAIIAAL